MPETRAAAYKRLKKLGAADLKGEAVVEICIPGQLKLFQSRIAKLDRVYYLDPPAPYLALSKAKPTAVEVRPFGDFFGELKELTAF